MRVPDRLSICVVPHITAVHYEMHLQYSCRTMFKQTTSRGLGDRPLILNQQYRIYVTSPQQTAAVTAKSPPVIIQRTTQAAARRGEDPPFALGWAG